MEELQKISADIQAINERNRRVEVDKAWERSWSRTGSVIVITYIIAMLLMRIIGVHDYPRNALIPVLGYFLSTQSLPFIKRWWVKRFYS